MKRCNVLKKCFAVMMSLALLLTMIPTSVFAETQSNTNSVGIDFNQKGNLIINKYDSDYSESNKKPISGVEFTAYKIFNLTQYGYTISDVFKGFFIKDDVTEAAAIESVQKMSASELVTLSSNLAAYIDDYNKNNESNEITGYRSELTNVSGQTTISGLDLGYYVIVETKYPDQVVTPTAPFFISLPMTNENGTAWIYELEVNPKNVTSTTGEGLTLTKYGQVGNETVSLLEGAEFELQKLEDGSWVKVETEKPLVTDQFGKITVNNLTRGKYRFVEISAPDGYIVDKTKNYEFEVVWNEANNQLEYVYNGSQSSSLNIEVTNEKPTIDKVVNGDLSANIGDTVSWKVTATVPSTIKDLKTFTITDTLSDGLTYTADSLVVTHNGNPLEKDTDYTLSVEGQVIKVILVPAKLTALKDVVVTYKTTLNENAVVGTDGNKNDVVLDYSTSTGTDSETKPTKPETDPKVYTFGLNLMKKDNAGTLLDDAEFKLCNDEATPKCTTFKTVNGVINFTGLAAGNYVLTEVKAPNGYNLLKSPINITITATYENNGKDLASVTATADSKDLNYNNETGYFEITVLNNKGFQLPATGGMGTVIFTIGGLSLMALAGGAYVASKRKESK
ncbi:MAG: SpaH/EbpB family LPXTG-anchored major pilin [Turicibacter sp.]|nr:SpaH/EbpB family LPXTG-anchored major pilin [Turicibacter sp.]